SPCGRLSHPRTTTKIPPPAAPIIGRLDHLAQSCGRKHGKVPKFTCCPFACLRDRLYPVRIPATGHRKLGRWLTRAPARAPGPRTSSGDRHSSGLSTDPPTSDWRIPCCNEASSIGSITLPITGTLTGPTTGGSPLSSGFDGFCLFMV